MSKLVNQWMDLFRAGDYTADGKGKFTTDDLDTIVANYNAADHEAPVVIGHPENDAPAYGWIGEIRRNGDLLQGKTRQVDPAFEEAVEKGRFKKRSVGLYNGVKGLALRHVGFLGAGVPHVKGLAELKFGQEDKDAIEIEFSEETEMADNNDKILDGVWDRLVAKLKGDQPTAKTFSEDDAKKLAKETADAAVAEAVKGLRTEFAELKSAQATSAVKTAAADAVAKLRAAGKWIPAFDKMGVPLLFEELAQSTTTVEFGEADRTTGAKLKVAPLDIAVAFFEGLKKIVPTDPIFTGQPATTTATAEKGAHVNETATVSADANSVQLDKATRAYMSEYKVSYDAALTATIAARPELAKPGGAAAGAA